MPTKHGLTKKEINRYKKNDLLKIAKDNGIEANRKMSKRELVNKVYKNKSLRKSLKAPEKRKLTEKQKANLAKYRIGKDFKNETKVKQPAQYTAEIRKIEDTETIGRGQPEEFGEKKIGEGNGQFRETQVELLKQNIETNKQSNKIENIEHIVSTHKSPDIVDQAIDESLGKINKRRLKKATMHAKSRKDIRFGQDEATPDETRGAVVSELTQLPIPDMVARLKQLKEINPDNKLIVLLEQLIEVKRNRPARKKPEEKKEDVEEKKEDDDISLMKKDLKRMSIAQLRQIAERLNISTIKLRETGGVKNKTREELIQEIVDNQS
jgi:hypothetical protein